MLRKLLLVTFIFMFVAQALAAQVYLTRNGTIRFFSEAPLENIEAVNRQVNSALNVENGEFVFRLPMRSFSFEKALMQEHFNDNFVESHKYPNASFQGEIPDIDDLDLTSGEEIDVVVQGDLTIKDVTKSIREAGTLRMQDDTIRGKAVFIVKPEEYNIRIPNRYTRNIASEIEVSVDVTLSPQ